MNKIQIKGLLRENLITEGYFDSEKTSFFHLIKCIEDLFINFNESINNSYKLDFFKGEIKKTLSEFKGTNNKENETKISYLKDKYDNDLLKSLGILDLLAKLNKTKDHKSLIDEYDKNLDKYVDSTYKMFKSKFKKDSKYNVLKAIENSNLVTFKKFIKDKYFLQVELMKLQEWVIKNDKKVLILFEGRDAAGKGGCIEYFKEHLNPKHCKVETFGIPTDKDKKDWFKRYKEVLPKKGQIVLYDRSWYNRAVIEPAMGYCTPEQYKTFMKTVGDFEQELINDKDIILFKIWLDISKDKQELRFELRKHDPLKYWKFSKNDEKMIKNWDKLTPYINKMLNKTSFTFSKWIKINSDDKFDSVLNTMRSILSSINYDNKALKTMGDKIIFLDFHGVIITNIVTTEDGHHDCNKGWDKKAINNLNTITDTTGAKIVLITDCKKAFTLEESKNHLREAGVTGEVAGKSIDIDKHLRAEQVKNWLDNHTVSSFVILDDKRFNLEANYKHNFIHTNPKEGITKSDVERAIEILK